MPTFRRWAREATWLISSPSCSPSREPLAGGAETPGAAAELDCSRARAGWKRARASLHNRARLPQPVPETNLDDHGFTARNLHGLQALLRPPCGHARRGREVSEMRRRSEAGARERGGNGEAGGAEELDVE